MAYPGDQQPHRPPYLPSGTPPRRDDPPSGDDATANRDAYGEDDPYRGPSYGGGEPSPYAGLRDGRPYEPEGGRLRDGAEGGQDPRAWAGSPQPQDPWGRPAQGQDGRGWTEQGARSWDQPTRAQDPRGWEQAAPGGGWDQPAPQDPRAWNQPAQNPATWNQPQQGTGAWDQPAQNPGTWDTPLQAPAAGGWNQPAPAEDPRAWGRPGPESPSGEQQTQAAWNAPSQPAFPQGQAQPAGSGGPDARQNTGLNTGQNAGRGEVLSAKAGRDAGGNAGSDKSQRRKGDAPLPGDPDWDPYAPGPLWRRPLVLGAALIALVAALFLGLWVAAKSETATPAPTASPTPKPMQTLPKGAGGTYGYTASRTTDKTPLSVKEVFGKVKVVRKGRAYVRTVVRKEKTCADGVTGPKITKALKDGHCTQLFRASFRDAKSTIIGSVGVANLTTSSAAKKVASAGGSGGERKDFLKPLPGKDDATKNLGGPGEAYAGGWAQGHYAVLLWFQFKDGHKPSKTELKKLYQTAVDITDSTVFPALDHRALTGGPA